MRAGPRHVQLKTIHPYLDGLGTIAEEAVAAAKELFSLVAIDRARLLAHPDTTIVTVISSRRSRVRW